MPLFSPLLARLEDHIKQTRRARLRHRTMVVIAQDRVDRLAATTGWAPPVVITAVGPPGHEGRHVIGKGGRHASR